MTKITEATPDQSLNLPIDRIDEGGMAFDVYELEDPSNPGNIQRLDVYNPRAFDGLINNGLDELPNDEFVIFRDEAYPGVHAFYRKGDQFIYRRSNGGVVGLNLQRQPTTPTTDGLTVGYTETKALFYDNGLNSLNFNSADTLAQREDMLGQVFRGIGFDPSEGAFPTPGGLKERLHNVQESTGQEMPRVRFFKEESIPAEPYLAAFADGEYPASSSLSWYGHDIASDHFRSLVVNGPEIISIAQLYAQAVLSSEQITGRVYPSPYEINKGDQAQKIEVLLNGQEKLDHAALCIDQFTSELDRVTTFIDGDVRPDVPLAPPEHMDFVGEMVKVIMSSPEHKTQLIELLRGRDSKALQEDSIDYAVYLTELLELARSRWNITVQSKDSVDDMSQAGYVEGIL